MTKGFKVTLRVCGGEDEMERLQREKAVVWVVSKSLRKARTTWEAGWVQM